MVTVTPKNVGKVLTTALAAVYTCPSGSTAVVIGSQIANIVSSNVTATVSWADASASTTTRLLKDGNVPAANSVIPIEKKLVLEAGDSVAALASAADSLEITLSILEIAQ